MAFSTYSDKTFTPVDFDNAYNFVKSAWENAHGRTRTRFTTAHMVYQDFNLWSLTYDQNPALLVRMTDPVKGRMCIQTSHNRQAMYFKRILPGQVYRVSKNLHSVDHVTVTKIKNSNEMQAHVTLYPKCTTKIPPEISSRREWKEHACNALYGVTNPREFKLYLKFDAGGRLVCDRTEKDIQHTLEEELHSWVRLYDAQKKYHRDVKVSNPTVPGLCGFTETENNAFEQRLEKVVNGTEVPPMPLRGGVDIRSNAGEYEWWKDDVNEHFRAFQEDIQERVKVLLEQFWICVKILSKQRNSAGNVTNLYSKTNSAFALLPAGESNRGEVKSAHPTNANNHTQTNKPAQRIKRKYKQKTANNNDISLKPEPKQNLNLKRARNIEEPNNRRVSIRTQNGAGPSGTVSLTRAQSNVGSNSGHDRKSKRPMLTFQPNPVQFHR